MEKGRHQGIIANEHIRIGGNPYENVKIFKNVGSLVTNQNSIQEKIKCRHKAENVIIRSKHFCILDFSLII